MDLWNDEGAAEDTAASRRIAICHQAGTSVEPFGETRAGAASLDLFLFTADLPRRMLHTREDYSQSPFRSTHIHVTLSDVSLLNLVLLIHLY